MLNKLIDLLIEANRTETEKEVKLVNAKYLWVTTGPENLSIQNFCIHFTDFNLSGGCFGTEIIQVHEMVKVHGLRLVPIEAEFQGASLLIQNNAEK